MATVIMDYPRDGGTYATDGSGNLVPFVVTGVVDVPGQVVLLYEDATGALLGSVAASAVPNVGGSHPGWYAWSIPVNSWTASAGAILPAATATSSGVVVSLRAAPAVASASATSSPGTVSISLATAAILSSATATGVANGLTPAAPQPLTGASATSAAGAMAPAGACSVPAATGSSSVQAVSLVGGSIGYSMFAATGTSSAGSITISSASTLLSNADFESTFGGENLTSYPSNPSGNWFGYISTWPGASAGAARSASGKVDGTYAALLSASGGYDADTDSNYDAQGAIVQRVTKAALDANPVIAFKVNLGISNVVPHAATTTNPHADLGCCVEIAILGTDGTTNITNTTSDIHRAQIWGLLNPDGASFGALSYRGIRRTPNTSLPQTISGFNLKAFTLSALQAGKTWADVGYVDVRIICYSDSTGQGGQQMAVDTASASGAAVSEGPLFKASSYGVIAHNASTFTVAMPSGLASEQLLIGAFRCSDTVGSGALANWIALGSALNNWQFAYKVATGSESTLTLGRLGASGSDDGIGYIESYVGAAATPIDTVGADGSYASSAYTMPAVAAGTVGERLITLACYSSTSAPTSTPSTGDPPLGIKSTSGDCAFPRLASSAHATSAPTYFAIAIWEGCASANPTPADVYASASSAWTIRRFSLTAP